ncbi:MAG: alpha-hydroxy-acid oxidizing protein, partial [Saprospiraceae bacterium]|nr:alpha-hydroxy-acid oxidizing protein [Saprospiraceae bacterium]
PTSIEALPDIVRLVKGRTAIILDSGIRSGLDILRALSLGAEFVLLGRAFIYGVAALGDYGGDHTTELLKLDLKNNMVQLGIERLDQLPTFFKK